MPDTINITLTEDDDNSATFTITSGGDPLGLASADVFAIVKPDQHVEDDAATAYELTEGDGVAILDAAPGSVRLDFPDAVAESPGSWFYKIRVTQGGTTRTAVVGWLSVSDV
ncbi:hypothetical protein ACFOY2_05285 [Nonomuraea purpurea]|uniref:PLAT domain-containing protein n=1 Tax=Nonomuraea purpurea TaxID=1849276 RepID=A0ABV8G230_9ACTN